MIEELIRKNQRKSIYLLITSFVILLIVGFVLGSLFYTYLAPRRGSDYESNRIWFALIFAGFIGLVELVQVYLIFNSKPRTLFKQLGLKEANQTQFSKLNNVIAEMSIAAGLARAPEAYVIASKAANAMAFGTRPETGAIAVTAGLLSICNRDELQGVVAHELAHLVNKDSMLLEVCRSTLGMVIVLRDVMLRSLYWGSMGRSSYRTSNRSSGKGNSGFGLVLIIIGVIFAIMAPILIQIIYFSLSREREYLADAVSARLTRYPAGLASALTKIAYSTTTLEKIDKVSAAAFIDQPYGDVVVTSKGTRTHPPIWNRIKILRKMIGGAGYLDYRKAYEEVVNTTAGFMPESVASSTTKLPLRMAEALVGEQSMVTSEAEMAALTDNVRTEDVIRLTEDYGFIDCDCGLKIKVPADYDKYEIKCPRCGRRHILSENMRGTLASMLDESAVTGAAAAGIIQDVLEDKGEPDYSKEEKQTYVRDKKGWQEIQCICGYKVQLSPTFIGRFISCRKCKRRITIIDKVE
ncbi:MAG: M48 family metalloprotease [Candidatus Stygibacter frigidus]|nr:M48 family metalloprotease [Candidatus Stygibacter frigidus]